MSRCVNYSGTFVFIARLKIVRERGSEHGKVKFECFVSSCLDDQYRIGYLILNWMALFAISIIPLLLIYFHCQPLVRAIFLFSLTVEISAVFELLCIVQISLIKSSSVYIYRCSNA